MKDKDDYLHYYDITALILTGILVSFISKYNEIFDIEFPILSNVIIFCKIIVFVILFMIGIIKKNTEDYSVLALRTLCTMMILHWLILYLMYG